jgi:hypothetical protein
VPFLKLHAYGVLFDRHSFQCLQKTKPWSRFLTASGKPGAGGRRGNNGDRLMNPHMINEFISFVYLDMAKELQDATYVQMNEVTVNCMSNIDTFIHRFNVSHSFCFFIN